MYSCNTGDTPTPTTNVKVVDTTKTTIIKDTIINKVIKDTLISNGSGTVFYSLIVQVLPSSSSSSSQNQLDGGTVTINSAIFLNNGTGTASINNGIAVFTGLPGGSVQGTVSGIAGYAPANFIAAIDPNGSGGSNSINGTTKTATVTVYLSPLNCSLNAGFYGDFSFANGGVANPSDPSNFVQPYLPNSGLYTGSMTITLDYLDNSIEPNIYTTTYAIGGQQQQQLFSNLPTGKAVLYVSYTITGEVAIVSNPNTNQTETITFDAPFSYTDTITFYNNAAIDLGFKPLIYTGVLTPITPE